ncbi:hypothetical protein HJA87_06050 [Rhizobium bangladeshense]|uniref:Uncharacterized protein n=1 Tax=Rhizobium bangladeshense TaxID=1138189 RepID=A0ABS7LD87_9HYPH|nr:MULTISPECIES: hypothetical protein [Rhizobium]MBX4865570.1 hypothetical protein [Rhizobium bangladeshense]MBX4875404.1 hypothetical protein [Rhizobium bangladeshense]MBX4882152.1 hypothetical protein [Rhizobium bangladeshense]MBX4902207.1 hypothetical protein [Rhizobium bangladeshense]MBX4919962.1 hypothetical protein [Rhizobium bangladeshense]
MWRGMIVLAGLLGAAGAAQADSRLFCSADDAQARFTLESGFASDAGHRLNHFRGALIVKDPAQAAFAKRLFESHHLSNHWSRDGELLLEVFDGGGDDTGGATLDLVVVAGKRGKPTANFSGTYSLTIEGGEKPYVAEGKVSCGTK